MKAIAITSMGVFFAHMVLSDSDDGKSVALLAVISHVLVLVYATHFISKQSHEESVHISNDGIRVADTNNGIKANNKRTKNSPQASR